MNNRGRLNSGTDRDLDREILRIQGAIEGWVRSNNLWGDCGFFNFVDYADAEPWNNYPVVTVFASDGEFNEIFESRDDLYDDFSSMLKRNGYWFERDTGKVYILSAGEAMNEKFKEYFHWQWVCGLLKPDFNDIHHELFEYFKENPGAMQRLNWRQFEYLVYELFRHQGYKADLGPGWADDGIDMTLLLMDPIGDILTAVQVKRYRSDRAINLQAVQALHGAAVAYGFQATTFVTTSRYLPSARRFANRENVGMSLFLSEDVRTWCESAHRGIVEDKNKLVSHQSLEKLLLDARQNPKEHIVHAYTGTTIMTNSFALKLKEAKHSALLLELPTNVISHDGYRTRGIELPELVGPIVVKAFQERKPIGIGNVVRAKKYADDNGSVRFWTGTEGYWPWDGEPKRFDIMD